VRLEPVYTLRYFYPSDRGIALTGAKGVEEHHFFFAEGRVEGRVSGAFRGANHPRRRTDETFAMNMQGYIETTDGATIMADYRGYGRSRARSDEMYSAAGVESGTTKFRRQVVGAARHITQDPKYLWLNDAVCAIAGEVRQSPDISSGRLKPEDIQLVFSVSEIIWEPPPE
jgi:Protein of unknown function (DUF3237)